MMATQLKHDWEVIEFREQKLAVQLNFTNETYVSSNMIPEQIEVIFNDLSFFVDTDGLTLEDDSAVLEQAIPPLLSASEEAALEAAGAAAMAVQVTTLASSFATNLILAGALQ